MDCESVVEAVYGVQDRIDYTNIMMEEMVSDVENLTEAALRVEMIQQFFYWGIGVIISIFLGYWLLKKFIFGTCKDLISGLGMRDRL